MNGITLIALVITIIVLLILAGVSIAMLTGENGILTKAQQAKNETENAQAEEKVKLCVMASYGNDGTLSLDELKTQVTNEGGTVTGESFPVTVTMDGHSFTVESNGKITENGTTGKDDTPTVGDLSSVTGNETTNTVLQDSLGNQVKIPAGFKVVNPTDTVPDGIVIEDVSHTATAGSQFVWIPLGTVKKADGTTVNIKLSRYTFNKTTGEETDQGENAIEDGSGDNCQELATSDKGNTTAKNITDFKTKANVSGGYYIGRYEARTATQRIAETDDSGLTQITCKADEYVYNYVTQPQAATLSRYMYNDSNFESDLVNSYAWDTAIVYLQAFGNNSNYSNKTTVNTSLATQGTNKLDTQDVICNIYDMASNTREWSTETSSRSNLPCIKRGGNYDGSSNIYTAYRLYTGTTGAYAGTAFRSLLYM